MTKRLIKKTEDYICIAICEKKCVEGNTWCPKCKPLKDIMLKLAEYEELDEQGKVIRTAGEEE